MGTEKSIVLFESADGSVELPVMLDPAREDVWLSRAQLATLFGRDVKTVGKHVANALREELAGSENRTVAKFATVQIEGTREVVRQVEHYNLDMVLSVGYRVKSARGVEFRRWATNVLRRYVVAGHAENERRLEQLGQVAKIMARVPESLESRQILDIVQSYTGALDLLDDYDHLSVTAPEGTPATHEITSRQARKASRAVRPAARRSDPCCMGLPGPSATSTVQPCARRMSVQAERSSSTWRNGRPARFSFFPTEKYAERPAQSGAFARSQSTQPSYQTEPERHAHATRRGSRTNA